MVSWVAVAIGLATLLITVIGVLIKVAVALSNNTQAIIALRDLMRKQEDFNVKHAEAMEDIKGRVLKIETVHAMRGCNEASA